MEKNEQFILKKINNDSFKMIKVDTDIEKITIYKNVSFMKKDIFSSCYKLKDVYYEGTLAEWCKIKFSNNCSNPLIFAKNFYIKENNKYKKFDFESIEIPDGENKILNYSFLNFRTLKEIIIPKSIKKIGFDAFSGCEALQDVYYCGNVIDWCNIVFMNEDSNPLSYAENFYVLDENNNFKKVCEIDIPNSVTKIGKYQFCGFSNIDKITLHDRVENIGEYAFSDCRKIKKIILPKSLKHINRGMFFNCSSLESVTISENIMEIDSSAFSYCDCLWDISVDVNNKNYKSIDGSLYSKDGKILIKCAIMKNISSYEIAKGTEIIGEGAFENKTHLTQIKILDSVTKICNYAFSNCTSLRSITITENVKEMGKYVFYNCDNLIVNCNMKKIPANWHFSWSRTNTCSLMEEKFKEVRVNLI